MQFLRIPTFNIVTNENTDYNDSSNVDIRTTFPNKTYLTDALDNVHQKYPQYSTLLEALKYANQLLSEEKTVIAVVVEEVKDHFKLHVKISNKYEHMDTAYSRIAHGMKNKHSSKLIRKVVPFYKTTEDLIEHAGYVTGNLINGYINVSLVLNIVFGGSIIFNILLLGLYQGYIKSFVKKQYHNKLIVYLKGSNETSRRVSNSSPIKLVEVELSESSEDSEQSPKHIINEEVPEHTDVYTGTDLSGELHYVYGELN